MLKIGDFSKLSRLTVKTLRFYEKEGLLKPAAVDGNNGYRFYETDQLVLAARIKSYRQIGLSIGEIKELLYGGEAKAVLRAKLEAMKEQRDRLNSNLSIIQYILEDEDMKYCVTEKVIPKQIVYYAEATLPSYSDIMSWILSLGEEVMKLNPDIKCPEPGYEFCEYLDGEYVEKNVRIRHSEAVTFIGKSNETIKFRELPETKVLCVLHKGAYEKIGEAYAFIMKYAEENGYKVSGLARECYIDGIWNKESVEEWLTEVELPIE